jgi:hypothetical protein
MPGADNLRHGSLGGQGPEVICNAMPPSDCSLCYCQNIYSGTLSHCTLLLMVIPWLYRCRIAVAARELMTCIRVISLTSRATLSLSTA